MTTRLNPYLSFRGTAAAALRLYADVFGGEPAITTFADGGMPGPDPDHVMHGQLETTSGFTLMCADVPAGMELSPGTNMSVSLSGDDATELRGYWKGLTTGGTVTVPLEKAPWGDEFGMCTDQFDVAWMVNITQG